MKIYISNDAELELVKKELDYFGVEDDIICKGSVVSLSGRFKEIFLVNGRLLDFVLSSDMPPMYLGQKMGEIKKGAFRFSLEFGTHIFNMAKSNAIRLKEEPAGLFLYGRDIFKENLPPNISLGRKLVGDTNGEFLGFGIFNGRILANVTDKGAYLRKLD